MNPVIPPRPEVAYVGVTTKPPGHDRSSASGGGGGGSGGGGSGAETPTRRREPPPLPPREPVDAEWSAREETFARELEEARARAAQMEKTMRWWSDCTANWREKWSKVRNERNKTREECRQLRARVDAAVKEATSAKREKQELAAEVETMRRQLDLCHSEKEHISVASSAGSQKSGLSDRDALDGVCIVDKDAVSAATALDDTSGVGGSVAGSTDLTSEQNFLDKLLSKKERDADTASEKSERRRSRRSVGPDGTVAAAASPDDALLQERVKMLQMKLDEALKTLQAEREEKNNVSKSMEKMVGNMSQLKTRYEDLKRSHQEAVEQVRKKLSKLQEEHQDELGRITMELEDESTTRSNMDKRLADLRKELERLQAENAQEWGRRERLETEKLALERENKNLRTEMSNLREELDRKGKHATAIIDSDIRSLQADISERTKELAELRHSHTKTKKLLQEKTTELEHAERRAEHYEMEVKKLRGRIDDLKKDLATAEDEVDSQSNQVRRLQRTNDELQEQVENLQVQVDHLQTRLRRTSQSLITRAASLKSYDPDSTDDPSDHEDGAD